MTNIIYPEPGKKDQWLKAMGDIFNKGFMTDKELYQCFKLGGTPQITLTKIKIRMDLVTVHFICN